MRDWCKRPGKRDEEGKLVYKTEQHHAEWCNVRAIIRRYDKTGLLDHVTKYEAKYGDLTGDDYKTMLDKVKAAESDFQKMPSHIRNRFKNSVEEYLRFFEDENNRDEAIKLGLISQDTPEDKDGIAEHVTENNDD